MPVEVLPPPARNRRGLLRSAAGWGCGLLTAAVGLGAAAVGRFFMPNAVAEAARVVRIGPPAGFPPGTVDARFKDRLGLWIVHAAIDGRWQIFALRANCTHLGCITVWHAGEQKFKCPCHGSGFRLDGLNVEGPAPRALERCALRLTEDGQLEVDCRRVYRRELGQWDDAASFVALG